MHIGFKWFYESLLVQADISNIQFIYLLILNYFYYQRIGLLINIIQFINVYHFDNYFSDSTPPYLEINSNFYLNIFQFDFYISFHNPFVNGYIYVLDRPDERNSY